MEEVLKRLHELKTAEVANYNNTNKDRDKNYAHGAMLAYSAAIQIIGNAMVNKSNENSDLNIPVVRVCSLSNKDFVVEEEMKVKQYCCKECGNLHVIYDDKYCSECGVKVEWHCR